VLKLPRTGIIGAKIAILAIVTSLTVLTGVLRRVNIIDRSRGFTSLLPNEAGILLGEVSIKKELVKRPIANALRGISIFGFNENTLSAFKLVHNTRKQIKTNAFLNKTVMDNIVYEKG